MSEEFAGWTPENVAKLTELYTAGAMPSEIARLFRVSRNVVLGKAYRLGLMGTRLGVRRIPAIKAPIRRKVTAPVEIRIAVRNDEIAKIAITDLTESTCRYPIGDVGTPDFGFCGALREHGAYCERHAQRCYVPVVRKGGKAEVAETASGAAVAA